MRFYNLDVADFQVDEYQVIASAYNYMQEGDFYKWNWIEGVSGKYTVRCEQDRFCNYTRAWPHTWLVAQSFKIFGVSEFSARLPSVIFGTFLIWVGYFFARRLFNSDLLSHLLAFTLAVSPSLIELSRITRMYIIFVPVYLLAICLVYVGITRSATFKLKSTKLRFFIDKYLNFDYRYLIVGLLLLGLSFILHMNALVFAGSLFLFFIYLLIARKEKKYILVVVGGVALMLIYWVLYNFFDFNLFQVGHLLTIRDEFNLKYFTALLGYPWGRAVFSLGVVSFLSPLLLWRFINKSHKESMVYIVIIAAFTCTFFVCFADRYFASRYISNVVPVAILSTMLIYFYFIYYCRIYYLKLLAVLFIVCSVLIGASGGFNKSMYKSRTDFEGSYQVILEKYDPKKDVIIAQYLRDYYLNDISRPAKYINMGTKKSFSLGDLKTVIAQHESGWIVWEAKKRKSHVNLEVFRYCCKHFEQLHGVGCKKKVDDSGVTMFYFDRSMIMSD